MAVNINSLVSREEQARLTPTELRTLKEYGDLFRRIRQKDIFGTVSGTLAAIGDSMAGGVTATSWVRQREGPGDTAERRAELLRTLAEYNQSRREERGRAEEARITQIGELAKNESELRKFALEKRVEMYNTQVSASGQIQAAQIRAYDNEMNRADRELDELRPPRSGAEASSKMSEASRKKYEDIVARIQEVEARTEGTGPVPPAVLAQEIQLGTSGLNEREMDLVLSGLKSQFSGTRSDLNETYRLGQRGQIEGTTGRQFQRRMQSGQRGAERAQEQFDQAQRDRDDIHGRFMSRFGVPRDSKLAEDMLNLSQAQGPDGVSNAMGSMGIQIPRELQTQVQDRALEDDDTTLAIKAELAKLDDPRYLFPGSPHEQLRRQIEDSPEYIKWRGETYGEGNVDPNRAFKQFLQVTRAELTPTESVNAMETANAITGAGSTPLAQRNAILKSNLVSGLQAQPEEFPSLGMQLGTKKPGQPGQYTGLMESEAVSFGEQKDLGELMREGAKRNRALRLARSLSSPDSNQASPLAASNAQLQTSRFRDQFSRSQKQMQQELFGREEEPNS